MRICACLVQGKGFVEFKEFEHFQSQKVNESKNVYRLIGLYSEHFLITLWDLNFHLNTG